MRKFIAAIGIVLMGTMLAAALTTAQAAEETGTTTGATTTEKPTGPEGCQVFQSGFSFFDPDCVIFTFTAQPPDSTTDTTAEIGWSVDVFGIDDERASDWREWEDKVCELDGVEIACPDSADPKVLLKDLAVGKHTFKVTAKTPEDRFEEEPPRSSRDSASTSLEICGVSEGSGVSCAKVTGEVTWTVVAKPQTTTTPPATTAETPAPTPTVTAQAPVAAPQACLSRRTLTIRIRERRGEKISSAKVLFNGKTIATSRRTSDGRLVAKIDFRKLPAGRFSVQIRAKLAGGGTRTYTRRYFTCEPKRPPSNNLESPKAL